MVSNARKAGRRSAFFKSHPTLWLFTGVVLVPLLIAVFLARSYLLGTLPQVEGVARVDGIHTPISISRDPQGVVHIDAGSDADIFFAMGYVHAQDRMWQLEVQRRMAKGTLAEAFGKGAVNFDIYIRTLGIYRNAETSWDTLSEPAQESLLAYASGVNRWLAEKHRLPVEFSVLGIRPEAWKPADSLAWIRMFALNLSGNYQQDLNRFTVAQAMNQSQYATLFGVTAATSPVTVAKSELAELQGLAALADAGAEIERKWHIGGRNVGSNAWVVAGKHSVNAVATLSNDPHLGLDLPSMWYVVDLEGDKLHAAGMSLVGLPLVMIGRNQHIGWGATNMMADTMDLYFEDINTGNLNQYRRGDAWVDFDSRVEIIAVKADFPASLREPLAPIEIRVRRTDTGPVVSDIIRNIERPLSLRWVGDSPRDISYDAFLSLNYASDWSSFKQALSAAASPALNMFYVDDEQNIGYLGVGKIPLRGRGNGGIPVPGWGEEFAWQGFIPAHEMPQSYNPDKGYIVSANNQVTGADYPYFISQDWAEPERAKRIEALLAQKILRGEKLAVADHQAIQRDVNDPQAREILTALSDMKSDDPQIGRMLAYLQKWDGSTDPTSIAATIFFSWMRHLRVELFADELQAPWGNPWLQRRLNALAADTSLPRVLLALNSRDFDWCDRRTTAEQESCSQIKLDALHAAADELSKLLGSNMKNWRWGEAHHAVYRHRPFSDIKGLDFLFERRSARGGSPNSVNLSQFSFDSKNGYVQSMGPGFRQIVQFGGADSQLLFMNSTGQSGNVVSDHYDDMIDAFTRGRYYEMSNGREQAARTLKLLPAGARGAP